MFCCVLQFFANLSLSRLGGWWSNIAWLWHLNIRRCLPFPSIKKITSGTDESQDETYTLWKKKIWRLILQVFVEFETIFQSFILSYTERSRLQYCFSNNMYIFTSITSRQYLKWTANTLVIIAIAALVNPVLIR